MGRKVSERKEFAPIGNKFKFFPFREDTFSEGRQMQFDRVACPEVYAFQSNILSVMF